MRYLGIFSFFLLLIFSACRKDSFNVDTDITTPDPKLESYVPPVNNITGSIIGFVVDENDTPVADATVNLGNITTQTDNFGHFFINDQTLNALGTLVRIEKEGYFGGSRRFYPLENQANRVKVKLLPKVFDQSFEATSGGMVSTPEGASIQFAPNSIKLANGTAYTGSVQVATQWMDPSAAATLDQMPGNLFGLNAQVEEVALGTFGMIAVELQSEDGQALNIADDQTAELSMPIPASMQNGAPNSIPLWSYNEEYGVWVEESTATLQDGKYVGNVSHFSFWNCDVPFDYVNFEVTLVGLDGSPVANTLVKITLTNGGSSIPVSGYGYTDSNGNVSGAVPANEALTLEILNACGEALFTQAIGPFSSDTNLGILPVSGLGLNTTTITGSLIDCNGDALDNGLVVAQFGNVQVYHYTTSADFTSTFSTCASTTDVEITAINLNDLVQSAPITGMANTYNDLGTISVCGNQLEEFISITIDGETEVFVNPNASVGNNFTYLEASGEVSGQDFYVGFGVEGITPGDYTDNSFVEIISVPALGWLYTSQDLIFTSFVLTQVDDFVIGSFTGEVNINGTIVQASGTFKVPVN